MMRAALLAVVAYSTALAVWTIGRLALGEVPQVAGVIAAGALLITQCIVSAIITPWLASDAKPAALISLVPLLMIPWPLLVLLIEISGISAVAIAASQLWVGGLTILSYFGARGLLRVFGEGRARTIVLTVLQVAPATALWAGRKAWIPWFTS